LLRNNSVYLGFGSCHRGWLLAYNATTLAETGVFTASPNLNGEGTYASVGGVWMGGGGPAADSSGNIYITTGNGVALHGMTLATFVRLDGPTFYEVEGREYQAFEEAI
jgi:hypothetical protein